MLPYLSGWRPLYNREKVRTGLSAISTVVALLSSNHAPSKEASPHPPTLLPTLSRDAWGKPLGRPCEWAHTPVISQPPRSPLSYEPVLGLSNSPKVLADILLAHVAVLCSICSSMGQCRLPPTHLSGAPMSPMMSLLCDVHSLMSSRKLMSFYFPLVIGQAPCS